MKKPEQLDLVALAQGPHMTPEQRRKLVPPRAKGSHGHVAPPGSGPLGETCKTCAHLVHKRMSRSYLKCGLNQAKWTGGPGSDVHARDPACRKWEDAA